MLKDAIEMLVSLEQNLAIQWVSSTDSRNSCLRRAILSSTGLQQKTGLELPAIAGFRTSDFCQTYDPVTLALLRL